MRRVLSLILICFATAPGAQSLRLRLCTLDRPFYPYTMPDGSGEAQLWLRHAAHGQRIEISNTTAPRARCLEQLRVGETDALIAVFVEERRAFGVYPPGSERADETYALVIPRFRVYRLRGSAVSWNGSSFSGLGDGSVAVQAGFAQAKQLVAIGAAVDTGASTTEQNLQKLALGRVAAVLALESEAQPIVDHAYSNRIEALPTPFTVAPLYLLVNRTFYTRHRERIDALWHAIRRGRVEAP